MKKHHDFSIEYIMPMLLPSFIPIVLIVLALKLGDGLTFDYPIIIPLLSNQW